MSPSFQEGVGNTFTQVQHGGNEIPSKDLDERSSPSRSLSDDIDSYKTLYKLEDHAEYLHLRKEIGGYYYCDVSHMLVESNISKLIKDYLSPISYQRLDAQYFGLNRTEVDESLPVRTMAIKIRPDITSDVVIRAIEEACEGHADMSARILNQHEGRFQCLILPVDETSEPFVIDAAMCTGRSGSIERQLIVRIFQAEEYIIDNNSSRHQNSKRNTAKKHRTDEDDLMIHINLHLKDSCCLMQYVERQGRDCVDPMKQPSPRSSTKACTAFLSGHYEPTFSVQLAKELNHPNFRVYPSLNSKDWSLIQSSWKTVARIWKTLSMANCVFHTVVDIPVFGKEEDKGSGPVLDLHYCSQIRQVARIRMLEEVASSFHEMETYLGGMERSRGNFVQMLEQSWTRYAIAPCKVREQSPPQLDLPSTNCPPGCTIQAAIIAKKCSLRDSDDPCALCDDAVRAVYETFCQQDDRLVRKKIKEANQSIMERLMSIQRKQANLIEQLEMHPNCQLEANLFSAMARHATNTRGRNDCSVRAKVPLLDFEIAGGNCQVTLTTILVATQGVFGAKKYQVFDLDAVVCEIRGKDCLAIVEAKDKNTTKRETPLCKIRTTANVESLKLFVDTLQTLQSSTPYLQQAQE